MSVTIFPHEIFMLCSDETKYQIALAKELSISIKAKPILCAAGDLAPQPTASHQAIMTATVKPTLLFTATGLGVCCVR